MFHLFRYFFYYYLSTTPLPPFQFALSLAHLAHTRLNSVRDSDKERPISVLYLLSKGSLPEDIIKSNEGASLTIC